jgi:hypothetical protein
MGGLGSGRCSWRKRKVRVEECATLEIDAWVVAGLLKYRAGQIQFTNPLTGNKDSLKYVVRRTDDPACLYLYLYHSDGSLKATWTPVTLLSKRQFFGGRRWCFFCPQSCRRWVRKLYCPAPGAVWGCRTCLDLTYRSVQEHGSPLAALRRNPALVDTALRMGSAYAARCVLRDDLKWQPKSFVSITELSIDPALEKLKDYEFRDFLSRHPDLGNFEGRQL